MSDVPDNRIAYAMVRITLPPATERPDEATFCLHYGQRLGRQFSGLVAIQSA